MRTNLHTALWAIPPAHSHAHIPERLSPIDERIVRLANVMGRPSVAVEAEIHELLARGFARGQLLALDDVIRAHGEGQAFYDGINGNDWPMDDNNG